MYTLKEVQIKTKKERMYIEKILGLPIDLLTWLFVHLPFTPNMLTILTIVLQCAATFILLGGDYISLIIGTLVFQLSMFFDMIDGNIARFRNQFSKIGVFLDGIGHHLANSLFFIFYSVGLMKIYDNVIFVIIGFFIVLFMLLEKTITLNPIYREDHQAPSVLEQGSGKIHALRIFFKIEYPLGFMFFGTLLGQARIVLYVYLALYVFNFVIQAYTNIKKIEKEAKQ